MYLGIDLGTSGVKTLLVDEEQNIIATAHAPLRVSRLHSGWSEQNPKDWISATQDTLDEIKISHPKELSAVQGIGLSGQMHGATLLGDGDQVLRPCMLWNDTRSEVEAKLMDEEPKFRKVSGNVVFPGFTAPKVEWVKNNEASIFAKIKKYYYPRTMFASG